MPILDDIQTARALTIREYITTQSRELKKKRHLRNLYYVLISSSFLDDFDDLIRGLKMDTDINEVCLVEAEAFIAMVDAKLRDPNLLTAAIILQKRNSYCAGCQRRTKLISWSAVLIQSAASSGS